MARPFSWRALLIRDNKRQCDNGLCERVQPHEINSRIVVAMCTTINVEFLGYIFVVAKITSAFLCISVKQWLQAVMSIYESKDEQA